MTERADLPALDETEANEADIQEQAEEVSPGDWVESRTTSDEVDAADAAEQSRSVDLDPEEYR